MTENEVKFMVYFKENILPNRNRVSTEMVRQAASLAGITPNLTCGTCLHNAAIDLLNLYGRVTPAYETYSKEEARKVEPVEEQIKVEPKKPIKKIKTDDDSL